MESIGKKMAIGSIWMVGLRLCIKGIGMISTLILVRLLAPEDFGIMGLAMTVYAFIQLMNSFGFDSALIQNQQAGRDHYDTAWTIRFLFSLVSGSALFLVSGWAAEFYGDSRLQPVLAIMSFMLFLAGVGNIGTVNFRKNMEFGREFKIQIIIKLCGFFVTVSLAWYLRSYWALLAGMVTTSVAAVILSYSMHPFRPWFSLSKWRELLGFSSWLYLNNILFYINHQSQNIILGRVADTHSVGIFTVSNEVGSITTNELVSPINRAAFPGYSKLAHDQEQLKNSYLGVLSYILLISLPCNIGIAAIAPVMVPVVLGNDWLEVVPVLQFIALSSIFASINTNSGYVYLALGKQRITTFTMLFRLSLFLPLLYNLSKQFGATGAGLAMLIVSLISFPLGQIILKKQINLMWIELFSVIRRPGLAALFMGLSVYALQSNNLDNLSSVSLLVVLIEMVLFGAIVFIVALSLLWIGAGKPKGAESTCLNIALGKIRNFRKRS